MIKYKKNSIFYFMTVVFLFFSANSWAVSVNDGFDPNVNGTVCSIIIQPDGRILIGGNFSSVGGITRNNIARLNLDGTLDSTFNPDVNSIVHCIALQTDGSIILGGEFTTINSETRNYIAKINADGTLNSAFNPNSNGFIRVLALQTDGKILLGGDYTAIGGYTRNRIARLNSDGSLDTGFDPNADGSVLSIAIQSNNSILIGGAFTSIGGIVRNYLASLDPDGNLQTSFNPDPNDMVFSLFIQPDGKILFGGAFTSIGGITRNRLARLKAEGTLDLSFNPDANGDISALAMQPDGGILLGGSFTLIGSETHDRFARLHLDGTPDSDFQAGADLPVLTISVQSDKSIVLGGDFLTVNGITRNRIARLYPSGVLDSTFNPGVSSSGDVMAIAYQLDAKILIGGTFNGVAGQPVNKLARLYPNGSLEASFAPNPNDQVNAIAIQQDNRIVVGGPFITIGGQTRNRIARINVNGTLDSTFDPNANGSVYGVHLLPNEKIMICGNFTNIGGQAQTRLARLNTDGTLDTSFSTSWINNNVRTFAVQPDGAIIAGGLFTTVGGQTRNYIARFNSDGSLDQNFNPNANYWVDSILIQPDGKIIVGGVFTMIGGQTRNRLARLFPDGSLDMSYNPDINPDIVDPNIEYRVLTMVLQTDGRILIGGWFTSVGGLTRMRIARLNSDGSVDQSFSPSVDGTRQCVNALALEPDGKTILGGGFISVNGTGRVRIARLSADYAAIQKLTISPEGSSVTWERSGSLPELEDVKFEESSDSLNWSPLGPGERVSGGWQILGLSLPLGVNHYIRAKGRAVSGDGDGSNPLVDSVRLFYINCNTYNLTIVKSGPGSGTVTSNPAGISCGSVCETSFCDGKEVTLDVAPAADSVFLGWSGDCASCGIALQCLIYMTSARSCGVFFQLDSDSDGIYDADDNCVFVYNPEQEDADNDDVGDACDSCTDTDGDGFGNPGYPVNTCQEDNCPDVSNPGQEDGDYPSGAVAAWRLDEGTGSLARDDVNSYDGTIFEATWTTGHSGTALSFDGLNDFVSVSDASALSPAQFTVVAWIRASAWGVEQWQNTIVGKDQTAPREGWVLRSGNPDGEGKARLSFTLAVNDAWPEAVSEQLIPLNTWTHVAGSFDGTTMRIYINGVERDQEVASAPYTTSTQPLNIGRSPYFNDRLFNGLIDEVALFNRALSLDEIQIIYQYGFSDGAGDACDCSNENPTVWGSPSESVSNLMITKELENNITWTAPSSSSWGSITVNYDLIRSTSPSDFLSAECRVFNIPHPTTFATDTELPGAGVAWFYLVRIKNACNNNGNLGKDSTGNPRAGKTCP